MKCLFLDANYLFFTIPNGESRIKGTKRAFIKLWSYFVRPLSERNVCCCIRHVQNQLLNEGLKRMRDASIEIHRNQPCICVCVVCHPVGTENGSTCFAHESLHFSTIALWESCVCPKGELDLWYNRSCLFGECPNYGVSKKLVFCPHKLEVDSTAILKWRMFEKIKSVINLQIGLSKAILTKSY